MSTPLSGQVSIVKVVSFHNAFPTGRVEASTENWDDLSLDLDRLVATKCRVWSKHQTETAVIWSCLITLCDPRARVLKGKVLRQTGCCDDLDPLVFRSRLSTGFMGTISLGCRGSSPALRGGTALACGAMGGREGLPDLCLKEV
jgi:hypothetical protein